MSKTIKVIDLLNKIANGEDVPRKIKWRDKIWDYWEGDQDYKSKQGRWFTSNLNDIRTKEFVNDTVEIIEEEPEIDIQEIEPLNAYKLMEAPFMADKLKEMNYDTFMEHLKQSEVEIANKIIELIRAVKQLDNQINNK